MIDKEFETHLKDYGLSLLEFMDLYAEFSALDEKERVKMITEYTDLITGKKKGEV